MKKSITVVTLLAGAVSIYAQGKIELGDYIPSTWTITVYGPATPTTTTQVTGNSSVDFPGGSTTYAGTPLGGGSTGTGPQAYGNGALWSLAVFAAPGVANNAGVTAAEQANTPVFTSLFQTSGGTGLANAGTAGQDSSGVWAANAGTAAVTVLPAGFTGGATFQLEAWYSGGTGISYANSPVTGQSAFESIAALGGTGSPPATTPTLGNFVPGDGQITSFSLVGSVPEPSTIALGVIGASTLLFRRRK